MSCVTGLSRRSSQQPAEFTQEQGTSKLEVPCFRYLGCRYLWARSVLDEPCNQDESATYGGTGRGSRSGAPGLRAVESGMDLRDGLSLQGRVSVPTVTQVMHKRERESYEVGSGHRRVSTV